MRALALMVVLGVVFSGCVASDASGDPKADSVDPSVVAPPSDTEGQIRGTITDDSLAPIAGAQIGILNSDPQVVVSTNAAGQFAMVGLLPGTYAVAAQSLGHESATRSVEVAAGEATEVNFVLTPVAIASEARYQTLIGEGYFACGAYLVVTSWGNLHACVFDEHKPRFVFEVDRTDLKGIMQEVVWTQSSGLTSQELAVRLQYGEPVCDPFCSEADMYADETGSSPVRIYTDMDGELDDKGDAAVHKLSSLTFPDGDETPVLVFQQRMTHYVTMFWGEKSNLEDFSAMPDA